MANEGFIKIHRSLLDWEWIDDASMLSVFMHCLLLANWKPGRYHGQTIERGSFVTSYEHLAQRTGLARSTVYRCMHRLSETGEIELIVKQSYTLVKVHNYALYQQSEEQGWNASETQNGTLAEREPNASRTRAEPIEERKKERSKEVKKNTKRKSSFRKREEILPPYWNPDPNRNGDQTPASPEEVEKVRKQLKGEKDETD